MHVCDFEEDALNCLFEGELNRNYAAHELNSHSSRSHAIYTIHIESRSRVESTEKMVYSKLHLVDLAGSERTKKTGTKGVQLTEARHVNQSLSYLLQVVLALCDQTRTHIPYRQTTLTNFLRDSLGGNCKTVCIANVHCTDSHIEETISTLKFANRMMQVKNEAVINTTVDPTLQIKRYEKEIRDLKQELAMHDTLANRGRVNYDQFSALEVSNIRNLTQKFLYEDGEIEHIDSLKMIREIFHQIKFEYKLTNQRIDGIKRQMTENPEKFKQMQQAKQDEEEKAKDEAVKADEGKAEEAEEGVEGEEGEDGEKAEKKSDKPKEKRPPMDK